MQDPCRKGRLALALAVLVLVIVASLSFAPEAVIAAASTESDIASGTSGSCTWVIDSEGTLTISPTSGSEGTLESFVEDGDTPWSDYSESILAVVIEEGVSTGEGAAYLFAHCGYLTSIEGLANLDVSAATTTYGMFWSCDSLTELDLSSWDVSSVQTMRYMFYGCESLVSIDVSGWDTSSVTSLYGTFSGCESLASLDVSSWDVSNVTEMHSLFNKCCSLTELDLSSWDVSSVTDMYRMFYCCCSLTELDLSSWDTSSVQMMKAVFRKCSSLTTLNISGWSTESVETMSYLFEDCTALVSVTVGSKFAFLDEAYLPVPYDATYGDGWWVSDDGSAYTDASEIPSYTAATYTAMFDDHDEHTYVAVVTDPTFSTDGYTTYTCSVCGDSYVETDEDSAIINSCLKVYRLYNPYTGEHLYTTDSNEYSTLAKLGWNQEGIAWYSPEDGTPVYRLYNPYTGEHLYTTDANEYATLAKLGWNKEGIALYSLDEDTDEAEPVYRLYNPYEDAFTHLFTSDANEYKELAKLGWNQEGIAFYGYLE